MTVRVDEPGTNRESGSIDDARRRRALDSAQVANRRDPVAAHAHVGRPSGSARTVDEEAAPDEEVERRHRRRMVPDADPPAAAPRVEAERPFAILPAPAWGYSSAGRASEWHSEGQGFESP